MSLVTITLDGVPYRLNRFGVVFAPDTPDIHLPGYVGVNFASYETSHRVITAATALGMTVKRWEGAEPVYDLAPVRKALRQQRKGEPK
jgi:hypothetical protein